jgi:phosphotransferase system enzyme I (PtsI)
MLHSALRSDTPPTLTNVPAGAIIVAADLTPAETAGLRGGAVAGFATAQGGPTSHTAILARSLGIPAAVGLGSSVLEIAGDTPLILDGHAGLLVADPTPDEQHTYTERLSEQHTAQARRSALRNRPGQLADGHRIGLWANLGHPDEAALALEYGAEGVGLFRTEFLFLDRSEPPTEDEQYTAYRRTLETMGQRPVVFRTLDIGGDKVIPYLHMPAEANPVLGVRGLRLCMRTPELLQTQFRALLRAALHGEVWIMLPMVSTPADLAWGREQIEAASASLSASGIDHCAGVPLGVMIETPAAAMTADVLARSAAFMSIGSNDLTQYTMAVDRSISELSAAYGHESVAVLRLIERTAAAANRAGIPVGVCGELAGEPHLAPLLAGMGLNELSMAPASIPLVKERLMTMTRAEARARAQQAIEG